MGDVGVVVEPWGVVVDIRHCHRHGGGAGQALGLPSVGGHDQQLVISPVLSVQQGAGDDLSRGGVDGELAMAAAQAVAAGEEKRRASFIQSFVEFGERGTESV